MGQQTRIEVEKTIYVNNVHRLVNNICHEMNRIRLLNSKIEFAKLLWNVSFDHGYPLTEYSNTVHWDVKVKSVSTLSMHLPIRCHFLTSAYTWIYFSLGINYDFKVTRDRREMLAQEKQNNWRSMQDGIFKSSNVVNRSSK
jgi:hypothetical protein